MKLKKKKLKEKTKFNPCQLSKLMALSMSPGSSPVKSKPRKIKKQGYKSIEC
jgi:hypothetical protein